MRLHRSSLILAAILALCCPRDTAAVPPSPRQAVRATWTIADTVREALIWLPASETQKPAPVLIAFHGHGGSPESAARSFRFHELWPEALVVYPRGLSTPGRLVDPKGEKSGWQSRQEEQGDRDLAFFDILLADAIGAYRGDPGRVFTAGYSNGGSFVYLLWAVRGGKLAGVAPSGSVPSERSAALSPKPAFLVAGRTDPLVKFEWQTRMIKMIRRMNDVGEERTWSAQCAYYPSGIGAPLAVYVHPGGHEYPEEASEFIVRFFREIPGLER